MDRELAGRTAATGDTTGCGDNFAGGVLASFAAQLQESPKGAIDLVKACALGAASGGFACFYVGGAYVEKGPGEKLSFVMDYYRDYAKQIEEVQTENDKIKGQIERYRDLHDKLVECGYIDVELGNINRYSFRTITDNILSVIPADQRHIIKRALDGLSDLNKMIEKQEALKP